MKRVLLIVAALVLLAGVTLTITKVTAAPAGAATAKVTVKGSTVGGMQNGQSGVPVMVEFKVTNHGSAAFGGNGDYFMSYFVSSNASITTVECVQNDTGGLPPHYDIGSVAPNGCQLGALPAHATGGGAIDVMVNSDASDASGLVVEACVGPTLNSQTYCGAVTVPLID